MTTITALSGWDPAQPTLGQLLARVWIFATATRLRRYTLAPLLLQVAFSVVVLAFPAQAHAVVQARDPILAALGVKDGYGVPVADYVFSTDYGSIFDLGTHAVMGTILTTQASLFVVLGGAAIWLVVNVLNFALLRTLVTPVVEVLQSYSVEILPGVFAIAAIITALIVAINLMGRNPSRAASQTAAALVVALLFGAFAYAPVSWTLSDSGPLAQGRDVAVALGANSAAGMDNTADTLQRLEGTWSTLFIRRPLQVWNFGSQVDDTPSCAQAWSIGIKSGDPDRVKDGVRDCGAPDSASMKAHADNPSPAQIGSGFGFLAFMGIFVVFCFTLSYRIVSEFFYALVQAVRLMINLAIGVIPGPTQAGLAGSLVAVLLGFVAMFSYITVTILFGEIVSRVFITQSNAVIALFSCIVLMMVAMRIMSRIPNAMRELSSKVSASVMSSIGGPAPAPAPPARNTAAALVGAAVGAGATLGGQHLARNTPAAARALNIVAPMVNNKTMRAANRGTHLSYAYGLARKNEPPPPDDDLGAGPDPGPPGGPQPPTGPPGPPGPRVPDEVPPPPSLGAPAPSAAPPGRPAPPTSADAASPPAPSASPAPPTWTPGTASPAQMSPPSPPSPPAPGGNQDRIAAAPPRAPGTATTSEAPEQPRRDLDIPSPQATADSSGPSAPPAPAQNTTSPATPAPAPPSPFPPLANPPSPPPDTGTAAESGPRPRPRTSPDRPLPPPLTGDQS